MQKIFRKYIIIIMTIATFVILVLNVYMKAETLKKQKYEDFTYRLNQVINIMENNSEELSRLEESINEDYIIRCKAAAFYIEETKETAYNSDQLQKLEEIIDVDEVHIIDKNGIILASSVEKYVNFDMYSGEQGQDFMEEAENKKEGEGIIQETMKNSAEGVIMKYAGVILQDGYIVQVGFKPTREIESKERNTYEYIFEKFPTSQSGEYFAIDIETDTVLGHSNTNMSGVKDENHSYEKMSECTDGRFVKMEDGETKYVVTKEYGNVLLGVADSGSKFYGEILRSTLKTAIQLLGIMLIVILVLDWLLKKIVVNGVHEILHDVTEIVGGNLNAIVHVGGNPEFEELSRGINIMVESMQYDNNHDHLTGLCNYKYFKDISGKRLAKKETDDLFAVVMLDLDLFKQVNDSYGHDMGDKYLREFAAVLNKMPQEHVYVARRSGDEFSMCIFDYKEKSDIDSLIRKLEELAKNVRVRVSETKEIPIRFSGGYVVTDNSKDLLEDLMRKADEALYRVKNGEKGKIEEF